MDNIVINEHGFVEAHVESLESVSHMILNTIHHDCPLFIRYQSQIRSKLFEVEELLGHNSLSSDRDHPAQKLNSYAYSLEGVCWQFLYSTVRLQVLADWVNSPGGQNSLISYYISYYFIDCVSRGKAVIDVLGLMINHIFGLGVKSERCGLDKGTIAATLAEISSGGKDHEYINNLYRNLDRQRNEWISGFYELRNIVIHRHEFGSLALAVTFDDNTGAPEHTHPFSVLFQDTPESIGHIRKIAPGSIISDLSVDPILFSSELWERLVSLVEIVCQGCHSHLEAFIRSVFPNDTSGDR